MPKTGPIIIVEDDADDRDLLKELLDEIRVPNLVRFFESAVTALDYLFTTGERPFLIISDINLPAVSGLDFLKKIHHHPDLKEKCIPFIFLTTASNHSVIDAAYQFPIQGFFVKPLTGRQMKQTIEAIINYWRFSRTPV